MAPHQSSDWKHLAEQASKETDPEKLLNLVSELNRVLGEREERHPPRRHHDPPKSSAA